MEQKIDYNIHEMILYVKEDEEVVDSIYHLYEPMIYNQTSKFRGITSSFNIDYNDLLQEANLAFTNAINSYNGSLGIKFNTYAILIIRRSLLNYIRKQSLSKKEFTLNALSLNYSDKFNNELLEKVTVSDLEDPLNKVIDYENLKSLVNKLDCLEGNERYVMIYLLNDLSIDEIAKKLNKSKSQIYYYIKKIKNLLL